MKKALKQYSRIFHFIGSQRIEGAPPNVSGDLSGVRGDIDDCEITEDERSSGVKIEDLIGE